MNHFCAYDTFHTAAVFFVFELQFVLWNKIWVNNFKQEMMFYFGPLTLQLCNG